MAAPFSPRKWRNIDPSQFAKGFTDIAYCNEDPEQKMDVFLPEAEGVWPVVVLVHGGGFTSGSRRVEHFSTMFKILAKGYAVASIDYRLAPKGHFPLQIHDVKAAIRYLRAHAPEFSVDTSKLVIWGNSAGAYLAALAGCRTGSDLLEDLSMGAPEQSSSVDGVIAWYGAYEFPEAEGVASLMLGEYASKPESTSVFTYLTEDYPPVLIQHGQKDHLVDWHQSLKLYECITEKCGNDHATVEFFPESDHGGPEIKCDRNLDRCVAFLDGIYFKDKPCTYARKPFPEIRFIEADDAKGDDYEH